MIKSDVKQINILYDQCHFKGIMYRYFCKGDDLDWDSSKIEYVALTIFPLLYVVYIEFQFV